MNDIEEAILASLGKLDPDSDELSVAIFIANLFEHGHVVKPLSNMDRIKIEKAIDRYR